MGQFADDGTFVVNEHTGEIFATKALDRDAPSGRPVWNFNVLAHDEVNGYRSSLTGYAEVRVMPRDIDDLGAPVCLRHVTRDVIVPRDINDNAPVFDQNRLVGRVPEHSRAGPHSECLMLFMQTWAICRNM